MRSLLLLISLLVAFSGLAVAAEDPPETCEQIRAQIGVPPLAAPDFLRKLAVRKDCAITSAEFYRAAYGDRPIPRETRSHRHERHDDDDD
jgi:hypothetical protein